MLLGGGKGEPREQSGRRSAGPQPRAVGSKDPEPGSRFVFVNTVWSWESKDKAMGGMVLKMFSHPKIERPTGKTDWQKAPPPATRSLLPVPSLKGRGQPHPEAPPFPPLLIGFVHYPLGLLHAGQHHRGLHFPRASCPDQRSGGQEWTQSPLRAPEPGWLTRRQGFPGTQNYLQHATFSLLSEALPGGAPSEGWSMIRTARSPTGPRSSFIPATRPRAHKVCKAHSALGR